MNSTCTGISMVLYKKSWLNINTIDFVSYNVILAAVTHYKTDSVGQNNALQEITESTDIMTLELNYNSPTVCIFSIFECNSDLLVMLQ